MRTILIAIVGSILLFGNVRADHEIDHRYNVRGYVLNAKEKGIENLSVQAFVEGELLGSTRTAADGFYTLHLHLHDADYQRKLKIKAGSYEAELKVNFEIGNDTTIRIHEANFIDGKLIEGTLGRFRIPGWSYAALGLVLFIMTFVLLEKRRRKKIRIAKYGTSNKQAHSGKKSKKARRKKH